MKGKVVLFGLLCLLGGAIAFGPKNRSVDANRRGETKLMGGNGEMRSANREAKRLARDVYCYSKALYVCAMAAVGHGRCVRLHCGNSSSAFRPAVDVAVPIPWSFGECQQEG
jgi:hypothetical protein